MRPRSEPLGKARLAKSLVGNISSLQWGRDLSLSERASALHQHFRTVALRFASATRLPRKLTSDRCHATAHAVATRIMLSSI